MPDYSQRELAELAEQEARLRLLSFDATTAWDLGSILRALAIKEQPERAACIVITQANSTPLFVAHTADSVSPAYFAEAENIRNTVKRWEISTWRAQRIINLDEKQDLLLAKSSEYSTKGGGWPIRVKGIAGVVAILVLTGLCCSTKEKTFNPLKYDPPTDFNHELIVKALETLLDKQKRASRHDQMSS